MSNTDSPDVVSATVDLPYVLVINCPEAQKYLSYNEVLNAIYGDSPVRIEIGSHDDFAWELLKPESKNPEIRLALLERFSHISKNEMPYFIKGAEFHLALLREILDRSGMSSKILHLVKVVIVEQDLITDLSPLYAVLKQFFSEATVFTTKYPGHGTPHRFA